MWRIFQKNLDVLLDGKVIFDPFPFYLRGLFDAPVSNLINWKKLPDCFYMCHGYSASHLNGREFIGLEIYGDWRFFFFSFISTSGGVLFLGSMVGHMRFLILQVGMIGKQAIFDEYDHLLCRVY